MRRAIFLSVTCLGISSIVTQIVTLREFLNVFSGNELVIGIILGNWLLLTGLGSYLGRRSDRIRNPVRWLLLCQIAIALLPPVQVAAIRLLKSLLLPGLMLGITEVFLASLILLTPYCLVSGFLLTLFSGMASRRQEAKQIGDVYVLDTLGDVAGGVIFSFFLVYFFTPFQTVAFLMILNLAAAAVLSSSVASTGERLSRSLPFLALLVISSLILWRSDLETLTTRAGFPGQEVLEQKTTAYGTLTMTRQGDQITLYENGLPVGSTYDPVSAEETVHYALSQHPDPKTVLLVSGGLAGAHRQASKYPLERIDYVELDPAVLELVEKVTQAGSDPRLRMIAEDARRLVRAARDEYDAILMDLPEPATAQLNRFYTVEFFREVHQALRSGGVFSLGLSAGENYSNEPVRTLGSSVHRALATVFQNILVIPGARQFLVASDHPLDYDIARRLRSRGIPTDFVRQDYLRAKLTNDRIAEAIENISSPAALNRDFFPVSYYAHLRYWLSQFGSGLLLPLLVVGVILILNGALLAGSRRPVVATAISSTGFTGMGLEIVLILAFQICYGYVYQQIGLIITASLLGAVLGAAWSNRRKTDAATILFRLDALLAGIAFLLPPIVTGLGAIESGFWFALVAPVIFPLLNGLVGFLLGAQFPAAARLTFEARTSKVEETAGSLYSFDLLGASLGAIAVSAFCVPLMGITGTCYLIGGIKILSASALRITRQGLTQVPGEARSERRFDPGALGTFGIVLLTFIGLGLLMIGERTNISLYAVSFLPAFHWFLVVLLGWGILRAMGVRFPQKFGPTFSSWSETIHDKTKIRVFRWVSFIGFAIVAFYPIFRCYFKIPYIFCHVCPRQCVFGFMRPYLVPATLIMNLENRYWCYQACPIGTLYDCQARTAARAKRLRLLSYLAVAALIFTAVSYFKIEWDLESGEAAIHDWYTYFFTNRYTVNLTVIGIAVGMILIAYRLRRAFCNILCPIGTFSDLILRLERSFRSKGALDG